MRGGSVVELFLASVVESGQFAGLPSLGVGIQSAENFAMKKKHGLAATGREGVVVREPCAQLGCSLFLPPQACDFFRGARVR